MSRTAGPEPSPRISTDPRISRRRKAVVRSRRRRALATAASVVVVAGLAWLAFLSPLLEVERVVVVGGRHVSVEDVEAAAGLDDGDNLLLLSTERVAQRVRRLPWVRRARVTRRLPDTVRVRVRERRPAMVLSTTKGRWTLDRAGRVLGRGAAGRTLPVLGGVRVAQLAPGDVLSEAEVQAALDVWRSLPRGLRARVAGVFASSLERIALSLDDDVVVRYGAAESMAAKNSVLRAVLARVRAEGRSVGYIDVRVPASPAISAAGSSPLPAPAAAPPE
jgi:cell division protein FtsQ